MQIKTISTVTGVNEIDFGNDDSRATAHFYWFKNLSDSTLYVSAMPNPVAGEDNVAELSAKGAASVETDEGKVYVLGAGKVEIHRTNSKFCPFELPSSGSGGGGGSITIDSELSETSVNPLQNKATTVAINEVKSGLDAKSDLDHTHDVSMTGNPVTLSDLQGNVPFSEIIISGDDIIGKQIAVGTLENNLFSLTRATGYTNGIIFTNNGDNSFNITGTSTSEGVFGIVLSEINLDILKKNITMFTMKNAVYGADTFNLFLVVKTASGNTVYTPNCPVDCRNMDIISATISLVINPGVTYDQSNVTVDLSIGNIVIVTPTSTPYTVSTDIIQNDGVNTVYATAGNLSITGARKYAAIKKVYTKIEEATAPIILEVGANRNYTSFTEAMRIASKITDRKVVVNVFAGEYDVYTELGGDEYVANIGDKIWKDVVPVLSGDVEIHGIGNATLKLEIPDNIYTEYKTACLQLSVINSEKSVSVDNITFICKNCRYAIHIECNNNYYTDATGSNHVVKNCRVYAVRAANCIGAGTVSGHFEIENCYFSNENTQGGCVFLHDWHKSTGGSLVISSCIFKSNPGNEVTLSVASNSVFDVYLYNNIFKNLYIQSSFSQYTENIFRIVGINNSISSIKFADGLSNPYPVKLVQTGDDYSTEEKVIGTWIDGTPLYQRTLVIPIDKVADRIRVSLGDDSYNIVSSDNYIQFTDGTVNVPIPTYCTANEWVSILFTPSTCEVYAANSTYLGTCYSTIRYTKLSDTASTTATKTEAE